MGCVCVGVSLGVGGAGGVVCEVWVGWWMGIGSLAELASILVAKVASLKTGWCPPKKKELANANGGIFGLGIHKCLMQLLHNHAVSSLMPKPALGGNKPAGCATPLPPHA